MVNHPSRYRNDDPFLIQLRTVALALPGAQEKVSHGRPVFYTTTVFAVFGGTVKGDHYDDRWSQSVLVLPDRAERLALLGDERFFEPAYHGPYGWIGLDFRAAEVDWAEVAELLDMSFRNTAGKRLIAELDARR